MATVIDTLFFELGINTSKFRGEASKATKSMDEMEKGAKKTAKSFDIAAGKLVGFISAAIVGTGLKKLIDDVTELNQKLDTTSKNLGMSARALAEWEGMAEMAGGSAGGMKNALQSISKAQTDMRVTGQSSMLPYMRALGVSMFNAAGQARPMTDIMLDLSDRFAGMSRADAFNFGQMMGFDEETLNVMLQGRGAMQDMLEIQKKIHRSTDEERKASRELAKSRTLLNQQLEALGVIIVNAITPALTKLVKIVSAFVGFLVKHDKFVKAFFIGLGIALTGVLIPALASAAAAAWALMMPIMLMAAPVIALATAFALLYDDYKTWAEGGTSLFDWGEFDNKLKKTGQSGENLRKVFLDLLGGYKSWAQVGRDFFDWLKFIGFIKDAKISVESLETGFLNLGKSIWNKLTPQFQHFISMLGKVSEAAWNVVTGNWDKAKTAWDEASAIAKSNWSPSMNKEIIGVGGNSKGKNEWKSNGAGSGGLGVADGVKQKVSNAIKLSNNKLESIARVAKNIGVSPNDLAAVISFETGGSFSPSAKNPLSSATGLIQFMSGSGGTKGAYYGMSRNQFASLSFDEQMNYVEKYFKERGFKAGQNRSVADAYTAVTGYGYRKGSSAYNLNKVWDSNKDGYIDKGEMVQNPSFRAHQKDYYSAQNFAQQASNSARMSTTNVNKTTEIAMNGDVHVHTSANTLKDNLMAASGAVYNRAIQFDTGMA